jgi:hypothetical protein
MGDWLDKVDVNTAYIEPGSPWENGLPGAKGLVRVRWHLKALIRVNGRTGHEREHVNVVNVYSHFYIS